MTRFPFFFLIFFLFVWWGFSSTPPFINQSWLYKGIDLGYNLSPNEYFLIPKLNTKDKPYIVVFNKKTNEIILFEGKEKKVVNEEFLKKENPKFVFISRGVFYDGKYLYIYGVIKYGLPKYVVLFRVSLNPYNVKYYIFKKPKQALWVKLSADGKGNVLLVWLDEDKQPYRLAYVYSSDFTKSFNSPKIIQKDEKIVLFEPVILERKPYILYIYKNNLIAFDAIIGKEKKLLKLEKPINFKIKKEGRDLWIAIQNGFNALNIYKFDKDLHLKKTYSYNKIYVNKKLYDIKEFNWSFYDFEVVNEKPIAVITAKFQSSPGVRVNSISLPDKHNVFVNEGDTFYIVNQTKPFLIYYTYPQIVTDRKNWLIAYFGRKFIFGNVFLSYEGIREKSDIAVEPPSEQTGFPKIIAIDRNYYRLLYPIKNNQGIRLKVVDIKADKLSHYYTFPPKELMEKKLKNRINKFIQCQIKNDLNCIYKLTDPVSREIIKTQPKAHIKVLNYKYDRIKIIENSPLALCEGSITVEIPAGGLPGINRNVVRTINTQDIWAFINGEWYYVPPVPMIGYYLKW